MNKIITSTFLSIGLVFSSYAVAQQKGGACGARSYDGPHTVFDCEHIGKVKIAQIYEKGWRVVSMGQPKDGGTFTYLIIEEQRSDK